MLSLLPAVVAVVAAVAPPAATVSGSDQPAAKRCVTAQEAIAAGDSGGAPPKFTRAFYARVFTLNTSLDGLDGKDLPMSIEEFCDVPKRLRKQAVQLAGADGIARISTSTHVWADGQRLTGTAATNAIDGADTAVLRVRLLRVRRWGEDEDGTKVATFKTRRLEVTD
jgi:hypothetical protein